MLYRPERGKFKDVSIFYEDGVYYLFSMYCTKKDEYNSVWLAVSSDGVHFHGIGPVIKNAPFPVWAMNVHKTDRGYILNHGSFTREGVQGVIKLWVSPNLKEWTYMGEEYDLLPPPGVDDARLDCMAVIETYEDSVKVFYGYPTSPWPVWRSLDGIHWKPMKREGFINWKDVPPSPMDAKEGAFEVAGCAPMGGRFYYLGGWFNYLGERGYRVQVLRADNPRGPFTPDLPAYFLCGNTKRWVSMWARLCRADDEWLTSSYLNEGYSYEQGDTWMSPLKRAAVDDRDHLHLYWWPKNEAIKGEALALPTTTISVTAKEYSSLGMDRLEAAFAPDRLELPFEGGTVVEFDWMADAQDAHTTAPWAGLYLAEDEVSGTAIFLGTQGATEIGLMTSGENGQLFAVEDRLTAGMSGAAVGVTRGKYHHMRLLVRKMMFEIYRDDQLAQVFNTSHKEGATGKTPVALCFLARCGSVRIENLRAWRMNL